MLLFQILQAKADTWKIVNLVGKCTDTGLYLIHTHVRVEFRAYRNYIWLSKIFSLMLVYCMYSQ